MANLYKISQEVNDDYDTYDSAVVVANSADEAKTIHPRGDGRPLVTSWDGWVSSPDQVQAEQIGIADPLLEVGTVVVSSFNAG